MFLLIREVMTPPAVSIPRERGATSNSKRSETASLVSPVRIAACVVASISSKAILCFLSFYLHSSTIGNCLVRVDRLVQLFPVEEVL